MEDRKHFFEDVCIPRNEFIKEHIHLLHLLRHGDRTQLLAEAKSQEAELKGKTGGSRAAGYIKKLIAMYKEGLEVFDINKMKWASDNLKAFGISMEEDEAPKKKAEEPKMANKLQAIIKKISDARLLKMSYDDGKTKDESGAYKYEKALKEYYDFMATEHGVFDKQDAAKMLFEFQKKAREEANGERTKRVYSQPAPAVTTPGKADVSRAASMDKPQHKTQTEGELLAELKVLTKKLDTKGWTDEDRKEYGRISKAIDEERDRQNKPAEAEKPAEAVKVVEQETEDAEEKEVGKFSYNMDFFGAIDKMYTIQRNRASVRGKAVDAKLFDAIVSIQNNYDLYPTPLKSLLPIFKDITELEGRYTTPLSFLEPSAGTGNIIRSIIDFGNVKKIKQIDAVEMSQDLAKLLQEQTSISNVYRQDFLTFQPKTEYHYIVMNPPYSDGNNKTFWLEHMMKAMSIAWNQVKDGGGIQCAIYIIIPTTYMDTMFKDYYKNNYGADKKYIGEEIPFDMNLCNKKKALVKEYGFYDDEHDDWDAEFFLKKVGIIDDFAKIERNGTARPLNITTGIYRLLEGRSGGKKKRSVHYNTY